MSALLNVPLPATTSFLEWARLMVEAFPQYNVINPASEDLWLDWAKQLYAIPEMVGLGVVDPRMFNRWQGWATTLYQVSN